MAVCLSHGGETIYKSQSPSRELLLATADGLYTLTQEEARRWQVSNHALRGHHVNAIIVEPASGTVFAGMHNGGIAASEDGGQTWEFRNQGLRSENAYSLSYRASGQGVVLFAGTEPAHIHRSEDMGRSWQEMPELRSVPSVPKWTFPAPPHIAHVKHITFAPENEKVIYASVEQGGLLKSVDDGATWTEVTGWMRLSGSYNDDPHRLIIRPSEPGSMFLPTGFGIYRSKDGGETWEEISERINPSIGYPDLLVYHPENDRLMFLAGGERNPGFWMGEGSARPKVARSRDGGETWKVLSLGRDEPMKPNFEAMTLEAWDNSYRIFIGNTDGEVYCTEDEGESWQRIADGLPAISKGGHYQILQAAGRR